VKTITYQQLVDLDACPGGRAYFLSRWPSGVVEVTEANALQIKIADLMWLARAVFEQVPFMQFMDEVDRAFVRTHAWTVPTIDKAGYHVAVAESFVRLYNAQEES
jgi:hypothetical protein